jgi:thiol-disulfide isomerase/thioredoxin
MLAKFRKTGFLIFAIFFAKLGFAQDELASIVNDEWYLNVGRKGLKVGEKLPDIPFGEVINNRTGKVRFSELKDKVIILDFWNTTCSSCIEKFPEMEKLQKEFADQIVIFLVNPFETRDQIEKRFNRSGGKKIVLPDLPVIVSKKPYTLDDVIESPIYRLFPHRGVPHHVWIGKNGVVKLIGSSENTYSKKIADFLEGKDVFVMNNSATIPVLDWGNNTPYYKLLGNFNQVPVISGSIITPYNNEMEGSRKKIIDSAAGVRRTYFINHDLLLIYVLGPLKNFLKPIADEIIYVPREPLWENFVLFDKAIDTSAFAANFFLNKKERVDSAYIKAQYCLEQVVPLTMSEERQDEYMFEDLNRFCKEKLGAVVNLEKKKLSCFSLIRTSSVDKVTVADDSPERVSLWSSINQIMQENQALSNFLINNKLAEQAYFIINETGWAREISVNLPISGKKFASLDELNKWLLRYDLKIAETVREVDFISIKEHHF